MLNAFVEVILDEFQQISDVNLVQNLDFSCAHGCQFDQNKIDFTCTCPENMELSDDLKNCQAKRVSNINAYEVTSRGKYDDQDENSQAEPEPSNLV